MTTALTADAPAGDLDAEALDWFVRCDRGLDAAGQAALDDWLAGDASRAAALARWRGDWQALDALPAAGIERLRQQLAQDKARERAAASSKEAGRTGRGTLLAGLKGWLPRPAMLAFTLCVSVTSLLVWHHLQQQPVFSQSFATLRGQQMDVELPDGSRMRLDTATRVEVTLYRQRREVRLPEGQVAFQVQGDASRPFNVQAGRVTVTVVGTKFSVRSTPDVPGDTGVRVAVEEGHVRVRRSSSPEATSATLSPGQAYTDENGTASAVDLRAGQQVVADAAGTPGPVTPVAAAGIAPWRDGRITFDDVPLARALAEFERYGRTGLVVHDDAVAALRLTGTFDPVRMGNFMQALPKVLPVTLRTRGDVTEIQPQR